MARYAKVEVSGESKETKGVRGERTADSVTNETENATVCVDPTSFRSDGRGIYVSRSTWDVSALNGEADCTISAARCVSGCVTDRWNVRTWTNRLH
jgi:hypothetical protein